MEMYIQMVGCHKLAVPPSLRLFVNGEFTLFNCGENMQRFLNEHKLHVVKTRNIFFTKINPETIGGLVGLLLTIDNIANSDISIYGPKPIEQIVNNFMSSFAKLKNIKLQVHEFCQSLPFVLKGNVVITPIVLQEKGESDMPNQCVEEVNHIEGKIAPESADTHREATNHSPEGGAVKHGSSGGSRLDNFKRRKLQGGCTLNGDNHKGVHENGEADKKHPSNGEHSPKDTQNGETHRKHRPSEGNSKENQLDRELLYEEGSPNTAEDERNDEGIKPEKGQVNKKFSTICYAIECPQTIGKFHVEKAKSLNIPPGKYYGILKSGKPITLNNKVINPEDVCDKNIDGRKALVIDLEDVADVKYLLDELATKGNFYLKNLEYIFHLCGEEITNMDNYKKFFLSLKNVKNVKCNQSSSSLKVCPFVSTASLNNFLSKLLPTIFLKYIADTPLYDLCHASPDDDDGKEGGKLASTEKEGGPTCQIGNSSQKESASYGPTAGGLKEMEKDAEKEVEKEMEKDAEKEVEKKLEKDAANQTECEQGDSYLVYNPLSKFVLHPFHKVSISTDEMLRELYPTIFNSAKISNVLRNNEDLLKRFEHFNNRATQSYLKVPSFYFLGTGCSMPSTFRNVSGIILNVEEDFRIVLDFGEGSLYQLYWMSQSWLHFSKTIKSIKVVFISHAHADHHMGLYYLLHMRRILFPHLDDPLILIPSTLKSWMNLFSELFFDKPVNVLYNEENLEVKEKLGDDDSFVFLRPFKVKHVKESYGIKIEHENIGSVVYSADTRPCDNVKMFSKNCDILIHEATFDDELLDEAIHKKHSTTHEAMQISLEVQCKTLILTHFSQRYPKAPKLNKSSSSEINEIMNKTIYSFDYMCIPLNLINELPHYFSILLNLLEKIF
ncbi:ribonuclease Z [Plasmodium inui San Antonio 1]|uniref:ribonuclease Z n=1 Tax=Plasmodium inui San Antonio 1 TaxID=1237626 RepID=W7AV26_9APIC|nr:ribonuclease Z [Plasmodium inui San Antonio 1]EUD69266.1 ribonuclease Z [Plasmodium inui San Antonio 1]